MLALQETKERTGPDPSAQYNVSLSALVKVSVTRMGDFLCSW